MTDDDIRRIAQAVADILEQREKKRCARKFVSTKEAAEILGITPARMRQIAHKYPHVKTGSSKQSTLRFEREALYR